MKLKTFEMRSTLEAHRPGGHEELLEIARHLGRVGRHDGLNPSSKEDTSNGPVDLPFIVVPPRVLIDAAPWLEDLYRGPFLDAARNFGGAEVVPSENVDAYPLINTHPVGSRYELHVDTNRFSGLYSLGERDRSPQTGGALLISRRGSVTGLPNLLADCERYYPKVGEFAVMDGYNITHCVEPSVDCSRTMLVCNFWTPEVPEGTRGVGLAEYQQGVNATV